MIRHQLPPPVPHDPNARETVFARDVLALVLSDHRGATGLDCGNSIHAHANLGGGDGLVRQHMRGEVSDDVCLVACDAGRSDAKKVIGIDAAKRDGVGSDLRANPLLILLLDGLLDARGISCLCALLLRDGALDNRQHERSDDRRSFHWTLHRTSCDHRARRPIQPGSHKELRHSGARDGAPRLPPRRSGSGTLSWPSTVLVPSPPAKRY